MKTLFYLVQWAGAYIAATIVVLLICGALIGGCECIARAVRAHGGPDWTNF